jgi:hypothetical protein
MGRIPTYSEKSLLFVIVNGELQAEALESDLQTKLNFTGRSEREHAGPHADAIRIVCRVHLSYDRMARFLAPYENRDALEVARNLDKKIEDLLRQAAA